MIIVMQSQATAKDLDWVKESLSRLGLGVHESTGEERVILGVIGDVRRVAPEMIESLSGVERVIRVLEPYKMASRKVHPHSSVIDCAGVAFGSTPVVLICGPCSIENMDMLRQTAEASRAGGAAMLRGGAFKPRSSPYSFQGLGEQALEMLATVKAETGLPVVTEVMAPEQVELVAGYADMLQIGTRNMQNYNLLQEVGRQRKPVMLKRGMSAPIDEWLQAAEYILAYGNTNVVLCERGIRTFESHTRFTLDLSAVPAVKKITHLPVIVDPCHGTGKRDLVIPMAMAAVAAGADGVLVEAHPNPEAALSDGPQSLRLEQISQLHQSLKGIAAAIGRSIHAAPGVPA
jgi:3-deoxy-7-phosphoheptulonate synthase